MCLIRSYFSRKSAPPVIRYDSYLSYVSTAHVTVTGRILRLVVRTVGNPACFQVPGHTFHRSWYSLIATFPLLHFRRSGSSLFSRLKSLARFAPVSYLSRYIFCQHTKWRVDSERRSNDQICDWTPQPPPPRQLTSSWPRHSSCQANDGSSTRSPEDRSAAPIYQDFDDKKQTQVLLAPWVPASRFSKCLRSFWRLQLEPVYLQHWRDQIGIMQNCSAPRQSGSPHSKWSLGSSTIRFAGAMSGFLLKHLASPVLVSSIEEI
ncbi:uncharacterized protein BDR25DRAFT_361770 [Lindgomyces ingoldianus]|uniref:Uncharacterized protein n=1 Tax=Lindgomyces ingoldianus TaxID=673940 RepID=A0ACB6QB51_9PLEO|nr:uncharacterized protein BDR25DRAFT_361770 [Lindgomyces ingoldianus]KAF2464264.1 hypothetical protein BDR25DRAFT_361770 [Lindgomyces ingoldianus]